jgi:hypothetical protein
MHPLSSFLGPAALLRPVAPFFALLQRLHTIRHAHFTPTLFLASMLPAAPVPNGKRRPKQR